MKPTMHSAYLAVFALLWGCSPPVVRIEVENTEDFNREATLIEIPVAMLEKKIKLKPGESYFVENGYVRTIPSQVTHDGYLIFPSGLGPGEHTHFTISAARERRFPPKTYGRFVPERFDDYVWENDRVAFRVYGQALMDKDGPVNGIDIWYKRTDEMITDKWYADHLEQKACYHMDHGEGMDDYKVGRSLGAGAMAPYADGKLRLNENFIAYETLDNGPLRTSFRVVYRDIDVNGERFRETRTFSLDAGSQLTKVVQEYGFTSPVEVAAGFPKRRTDHAWLAGNDWLICEEPPTAKSQGVYLGLIIPQGIDRIEECTYDIPQEAKNAGTYTHTLAVTTYRPGQPVTYYTGFGWELYGFPRPDDFERYIRNFSAGLRNPIRITHVE